MKLSENLSFLTGAATITHPVGGVDLEFSPASAKTLFSIRPLLGSLTKLLAAMFMQQAPDHRTQATEASETNTGVAEGSEATVSDVATNTVEAITVELYGKKIETMEEAFKALILQATSPGFQKLIGDAILESCGESLQALDPDVDMGKVSGQEFFNQVSTPALVDLLTGVFKANEGVLGKLIDGAALVKTAGVN